MLSAEDRETFIPFTRTMQSSFNKPASSANDPGKKTCNLGHYELVNHPQSDIQILQGANILYRQVHTLGKSGSRTVDSVTQIDTGDEILQIL